MSFQDDLDAELAAIRKGPPCSIAEILDAMTAENREKFTRSLEAPVSQIPHVVIVRALARGGHQVKASTVSRHRHRECACP